MSSDPKDLPLTPDGLRARTAAYRESLSAPDTNDMFSLAYQWQDKNHRHVTDLCLVIEEVAKTIEALQAEVAKVKASAKKFFDDAGAITKNADQELEDMADALRVTLDAKNAAEARAERLRMVLEDAVAWMNGCAVSGGYPAWHAKAIKALEDKQ